MSRVGLELKSSACKAELLSISTQLHSFVVRTYYGPYIKAESKNQIAARAILKIFLALHEDVKIIA